MRGLAAHRTGMWSRLVAEMRVLMLHPQPKDTIGWVNKEVAQPDQDKRCVKNGAGGMWARH